MTPKRYFAFGCITVLLQGVVLASQNSEPDLTLSAGSAMGMQAVNVSIAMRASQATAATPSQPAVTDDQAVKQSTSPIEKPSKPQAVEKAKQAKPVAEKPPVKKPEVPKTEPTEAKPQQTQVAKNKPEPDTMVESQADTEPAHEQNQSEAKQGVSQQHVVIEQPTFAAPPAQPHYPKKARKRGLQGTATIEVMFNQLGEQLSLELVDSSGYRLLDKAALAAVKQWQFAAPSPQTALAYTVRVPIKFALN
ncbi:energy transducer TonB [Shewanella sp. Scap07]|uniref:energy transducer TonB n=1 Tax=Shewanella sp. Scap07 TaxID=2589987 RepID=UPI0015BA87D6|nr:energy transducer TonB [Shewanella sp. Scap07]QLE86673.1 energy transducer TonB [Shewanella sp. Scap07]